MLNLNAIPDSEFGMFGGVFGVVSDGASMVHQMRSDTHFPHYPHKFKKNCNLEK